MEAPDIAPVPTAEEAAEELRQVIVELLVPPTAMNPAFTVKMKEHDQPFTLGCSSDDEVDLLLDTNPGFVSIDVDEENRYKGLSADQTIALEMSAEQAEINRQAKFDVRARPGTRDYFQLWHIVRQEAERAGVELEDSVLKDIVTHRAISLNIR